jgi:putative endonuclease
MSVQQKIGIAGELAVRRYLEQQGFVVCARNYIKRTGEIDLIVSKGSVYAFVEVKARSKQYFALSDVITTVKKNRIIQTALWYKQEHLQKVPAVVLRFDVAFVLADTSEVVYLPNAFSVESASIVW